MKMRLAGLAMAAAFLLTFVLAPAVGHAAPAAPSTNAVTVPVTGTIPNGGGTFTGAYTITRFVNQNGTLTAVGTLSGTLTNALGNTIGSVTNMPVQAPVTNASGSCTILDLTLGPLHLNLLGLVVDLNQVHLTITAQQGAGNLLGNLLCAVANLLNGGAPLGSLAGLLNSILRAL
ncbi:MAG TPA: hypothetical protein VFN11_15700 [Ktedonobacterales bacterium]|jgi:hypothetical protein|nr:hypothetical protein [Ktedonobacterales bacterium]